MSKKQELTVWQRFVRLFVSEYRVDIWYPADKFGKRTHEVVELRSISKITSTHIRGRNLENHLWELKTVEPFDFRIEQTA